MLCLAVVTILLIGYYGFANAGDEVILASIVAQLRSHAPGVTLLVSSGDSAATARTHHVEAVAWNRLAELERAVERADLMIIGGGGLFHDYWGADPDTLLTERHWGIAYYCSCAFLAALYRKPLFLYAVGVGPLVSSYGMRMTRAVCDCAARITVRDSGSRDWLLRSGIADSKIRVTADPAWAFAPSIPAPLTASGPKSPALPSPVLGAAIRNWSVGVDPAFLESELATALDLYIEQTRGSVVFFPFQQLAGEREDDKAIARRVLARMRRSESASIASVASEPESIYDGLRGCQVILGMRLHALIFAATLGIPSVALAYDPKIDALETPFARFDVKAIDARELSRSLTAAVSAELPISTGQLRALALETARLALDLLEAPVEPPAFSADALDLLRRAVSAQLQDAERARLHDANQEARVLAFEGENGKLRNLLAASEHTLQTHLDEAARFRHEAAMFRQEAGHARAVISAALDRFQANFEAELNALRSQKAWQMMLLIRKAYTRAVRGSKSGFLRWAAGAAVGNWGPLGEFEPRFPQLSDYVPDSYRVLPAANPSAPVPTRRATQSARDRFDVVILAIIDFDFRFQRPQQIAAEMARRGHRVFWISPSRFLPPASEEPYAVVPLRPNLWEIRLRSAAADIYMGELKPEHVAAMTASLTALQDDWNIGVNVALIQLPFWRRLALELRSLAGSKLLYDCMDDWETFQNMGAFNVAEEKHLVGECDVLIVTGAELETKYRAQQLAPVLVRNGADYAFFAQAGNLDLLADVRRPIVGYFGAIADWIDLDLVAHVAQSRPQYSFVLIGQVFGRDTSALEALPNVILTGNKRYEDIPAYLYHFDACLIPFLLNQVTKATDPVKLYEYFSLGKPVIATDMAELQQCGDLIYIGHGPDDFASKIDSALNEAGSTLRERRIAFAQANTWGSRVDQIEAAARSLFPLVSILIVTYNSEEFVRPCLDSLFRNTAYPAYEVIVVDNASTDSTLQILETYTRIRLIASAENTGFAAANNQAAEQSSGAYLVFLNVDTMVPPGWLDRLVTHVQNDSTIGQICPVTNFAGNEAKINVTYENAAGMEDFAAERTRAYRGQVLDMRVAPLFCALVPRAVWDRVGPLDSTFGMGMFEDDDFSMRIHAEGLRVVAAEDCFVHHFGQGSFSKLPSETYNRTFERNRALMEAKWKAPWQPHRTRPGVRPAFEEQRFHPATFLEPA